MNNDREKILNKLSFNPNISVDKDIDENQQVFAKKTGDLISIFKTEAEIVNAQVFVVEKKKLETELNNFLRNNNFYNIYSNQNIKLDNDFNIINELNTSVETGIGSCEYLCARTGSILVSSHSNGRKINIFPETHIIIANETQLVPDIKDGIKALKEKYQELPSSISFITGPSRTADIEKTLILGAHGPKNLIIFIVKN